MTRLVEVAPGAMGHCEPVTIVAAFSARSAGGVVTYRTAMGKFAGRSLGGGWRTRQARGHARKQLSRSAEK